MSIFITYFEKLNVYSCYFIAIIPLGIIYYFAILPWSTPDAIRHLSATYRFSNIALMQDEWNSRTIDSDFFENVWINYTNVNRSGYHAVMDHINDPVYSKKTEELSIKNVNMTVYSFTSYLPLITGIVLGRLLNLNTLQMIYTARFFMFIFYVLGVFLALKTIPKFKYIIAMISILPISLMYASGISYDGMVIITTLNFISSLLAFNQKNTKLNFSMLLIWTFLMISCKGGGYIILLPLVFILKNHKSIIAVLATAFVSLLIFNNFLYTNQPMFQFNKNIPDYLYTGWGVEHPLKYLSILSNTYQKSFLKLFFEMFGAKLGWLYDTVSESFILLLFIIMILSTLKDGITIKDKTKNVFLYIIILATASLTIPFLLLCETPNDAASISGIQGRYYLPILPVFIFLVGNIPNKLPVKYQNIIEKINTKVLSLCFICASYFCVYSMIYRFLRAYDNTCCYSLF